jgi:hypothetical protein
MKRVDRLKVLETIAWGLVGLVLVTFVLERI